MTLPRSHSLYRTGVGAKPSLSQHPTGFRISIYPDVTHPHGLRNEWTRASVQLDELWAVWPWELHFVSCLSFLTLNCFECFLPHGAVNENLKPTGQCPSQSKHSKEFRIIISNRCSFTISKPTGLPNRGMHDIAYKLGFALGRDPRGYFLIWAQALLQSGTEK